MCLICGHTGCGRYVEAHAREHYEATGHTYSLEIETQRVWDYTGDGYVHRLIQNAVDGKMVEFPDSDASQQHRQEGEDLKELDKSALEDLILHYEESLQTELNSQRQYFTDELNLARMTAEKLHEENRILEKRNQALENRDKESQRELEFLRQMNTELAKNQKEWDVKFKVSEARAAKALVEKDAELEDMKSLNADMMSNIEALQQMIAVGEQGGTAKMAAPAEEETLQEKMRKAKERRKKAAGR